MGRFKIPQSEDIEAIRQELNRTLKKVEGELNRLSGYSGDLYMEARSIHSEDLIFNKPNKGLVLKDDGNPARYWRPWVAADGTVATETIDPEFKD